MKPFITDIQEFLRQPQDTGLEKFSIRRVWEVYSWISISALILAVVIQLVVWYADITLQNSVQDFVLEATALQVILLAVVAAPIIEEFLFRLPVTTKKWMWGVWALLLPIVFWFFGLSST